MTHDTKEDLNNVSPKITGGHVLLDAASKLQWNELKTIGLTYRHNERKMESIH